jgi:hypothetical protein
MTNLKIVGVNNISDKNKITSDFDKAIEYIENKIIKSPLMKVIKKIQSVAAAIRSSHYAAHEIDKFFHPEIKKIVEDGGIDNRLLAKASSPIRATRLLGLFSVVVNLTTLVKSIKNFIVNKGIKKLDAFLQAVKSVTSVTTNVESILYGISALTPAVKVSLVAQKIFGAFSLVGSVFSLAITSRSLSKADNFYKKFKNKITKIDNNPYTVEQYKKILSFFKDKKKIAKLGIDKTEEFQKAIDEKFKLEPNQIENDAAQITVIQQEAIDKLVHQLDDQLKTTKTQNVVSIVSDVLSFASTCLLIASVACPPLLIISAIFTVTTSVGFYIHKQITDYTFEKEMGIYNSEPPKDLKGAGLTLWKVKDFAKWYFEEAKKTARDFIEAFRPKTPDSKTAAEITAETNIINAFKTNTGSA